MPHRKKLSKAEYETLASFRFALRQFLRFSEAAAESVGLKPQQHQALLTVKGYPERDYVTVGELAAQLQIKHHSAVGLVDRLVSKKLVMRDPSPTDRRQVWIRLTARGEETLEKLSAAHHEQLRRIGPELSDLLEQVGDESASRSRQD
jgi:DNA-binding MarR family transcriptional regulator